MHMHIRLIRTVQQYLMDCSLHLIKFNALICELNGRCIKKFKKRINTKTFSILV